MASISQREPGLACPSSPIQHDLRTGEDKASGGQHSNPLPSGSVSVRGHDGAREQYENGSVTNWMQQTQAARVFYPTLDEFSDPLAYIHSIREKAMPLGICKIVPPVHAATPCVEVMYSGKEAAKFPTREQVIRKLPWDSWDRTRFWSGHPKTPSSFSKLAEQRAMRVFRTAMQMPSQAVEVEFWKQLAMPSRGGDDLVVEYADNVDGTGFSSDPRDPLGASLWNLNRLPLCEGSCLRLITNAVPGVSAPMTYAGMLFSYFAWHVEDCNMFSINYHHVGAAKTWYAVGPQHAQDLEDMLEEDVYTEVVTKMREQGASSEEIRRQALLAVSKKTTMFCPELLLKRGVPVTHTVQAPGEFVVTFPKAYHGGFSHGANIGEAVNFATRSWFDMGADSILRSAHLGAVPALPFEQVVVFETLALIEVLKSRAPPAATFGSPAFSTWLRDPAAQQITSADVPLVTTFCRLIRWYHRTVYALMQRGARLISQAIDLSVPCPYSGEMMHVAALMSEQADRPVSLRYHAILEQQGGDAAERSLAGAVVVLHDQFSNYVDTASCLADSCAAEGWGSIDEEAWRTAGLSDRLALPNGKLFYAWEDLSEPYSWPAVRLSSPTSSIQNSNISSTEACALRPSGDVLGMLEHLLPAEAPVKASQAVPPSKAAAKRTPIKKGGKRGAVTPAGPTPAASSVKDEAMPPLENSNPIHSVVKRKKLTPDNTPGRDGAMHNSPPMEEAADTSLANVKPVRRRARASAVSAMESFKQAQMFSDEEDSPSDSETRTVKRGRRAKRDEPSSVSHGAPPPSKPGVSLAKVYSSSAIGNHPSPSADSGPQGAPPSLQRGPSVPASRSHAPSGGAAHMSNMHGGRSSVASMWTSTPDGPPPRPASSSMNPPPTHSGSGMGDYRDRQNQWMVRQMEMENAWRKQLHGGSIINNDTKVILGYFLNLRPVSLSYPQGGAPPGHGNGHGGGGQQTPALLNASVSSSLNLGSAGVPRHVDPNMMPSLGGSAAAAAGRSAGHSPAPAWPTSNRPSSKASLHNGPISAQDLATGMRERERDREHERSTNSDDGSKGKPRTSSGKPRGRGRGRGSSSGRGPSDSGAAPSGSQADRPPNQQQMGTGSQATIGAAVSNGNVPSLPMNAINPDGHAASPRNPLMPDVSLDTPHSVSEIIDGPGEINDLMRFLGTEPDNDNDIDF